MTTASDGSFLSDTTGKDAGSFADITGDGKADYIVPWNNGGRRFLAAYIAKGDGTFNEFINTASNDSFLSDITGKDAGSFADVTGDGKADYIIPWNNGGRRCLATYIAKGNGTFYELINTMSEGGFVLDKSGRDSGSFADVTGDGKADYILPWNNSGKRFLATYVAKGDGTFNEFVNTASDRNFLPDATGKDAGSFADVTGDGKTDYIIPWNNGGKRSLTVYVAKGDGTFNEFVNTASNGSFLSDTIGRDAGSFADITGDGKADYVVPWNNGGERCLAAYIAKGDGTFYELVSTVSEGGFVLDKLGRDSGVFTDVTGDKKADYIIPWNNGGKRFLATYVAKSDGTFNEFVNTASNSSFLFDTTGKDAGIFADVTGDGKADYIIPWNNGGRRFFKTYIAKGENIGVRDVYTYIYNPSNYRLEYIEINSKPVVKFIYDNNGNLINKEVLQ